VENIKTEVEEKTNDFAAHKEAKKEVRDELSELITNCEQLYNEYDVVRIQVSGGRRKECDVNKISLHQQVLEMKNNRKNDSFSSAWPTTESNSAWPAQEATREPEPVADEPTPAGYMKYRAIYEFSGRNQDEITFQPGDIIMVR
jgi:intersectin